MPKPDPSTSLGMAGWSASVTTLRPYRPYADRLGAAMSLATDVTGLRLVVATTIADR